jgi:hypothetical protein
MFGHGREGATGMVGEEGSAQWLLCQSRVEKGKKVGVDSGRG